ncbi:hypothetical protein GGR23_003320 [Gellertiella hungarica]|uniref:Uncharacterized protein n=1 Tax=Gellertiella hungarica TaxID=1572859 RepID=A0A7W6J8W6_9HYPH|nr:hypothetical protein [Gellertiella hungarica]
MIKILLQRTLHNYDFRIAAMQEMQRCPPAADPVL